MKTYIECLPCFVRQSLDTARRASNDSELQKQIMRTSLRQLAELDFDKSPPEMAQEIHRTIRSLTGGVDLYYEIKKWSNRKALEMLEKMHKEIESSTCKFETAIRLAIAGNIIDFGAKSHVSDEMVDEVVTESLTMEMDLSEIESLKQEIEKAETILYILDNAGEIVFDRMLIEQLPRKKVIAVVRGQAIINDVTMEDAREVGLTEIVRVIDNGSDAPGTILETCSKEFNAIFEKADLIIAKGQGNFETMSSIQKNIFFLLKVKCPVIADNIGKPLGAMVLVRQNSFNQ